MVLGIGQALVIGLSDGAIRSMPSAFDRSGVLVVMRDVQHAVRGFGLCLLLKVRPNRLPVAQITTFLSSP
jgi:hypothetical protein